ncbi:MAG: ABC transporter permease, partial [Bradymonadaceae bacterium]
MKGLYLVIRRELAAYVNSIWGYIVVAAILVIDGLLFNAFALGTEARLSENVLRQFFYFSFGTTMVASILLTMPLIARERQSGTINLLDSSPLSDWQIVGGKWLSAFLFVTAMTLLTLYMPALIFVNGKVSVGHIAAGYLGLISVGA